MDQQVSRALQQFKNSVGIRFQLYNSLFTSLPFHRIEKTGTLLSLLLINCEEGFKNKRSPVQIIDEFFTKHTMLVNQKDKMDVLFRFIQFVERQIVLFDALEDAAFRDINDLSGVGTVKHLEGQILQNQKEEELAHKLKDYAIRLVLTAHPTQFYPDTVLGIINDLSKALKENDTLEINMFLQQLGKTPFFKKQKPTPYDEAISLIWYLENVFYSAIGRIITSIRTEFPNAVSNDNPIINMGFWPGGDRDGNPFVTSETTLKVADALRGAIIHCYYLDIRRLKRRLTFKGIETILTRLEKKLYNNIFIPGQRVPLSKQSMLDALNQVREILIYQNNGLFLHLVDNLMNKLHVFGLHFASLDIRQESSIHNNVLETIAAETEFLPSNYSSLSNDQKVELLTHIDKTITTSEFENSLVTDTIQTIKAVKTIQANNGELGCNRYIISQCNSALNVLEVYGLFLLCAWKKEEMTIDIIPLFETVEDLQYAASTMEMLYTNKVYAEHLNFRNRCQTIMLGFSDGTKDGGYLMANWGIYKAKEELTAVSKKYNIDVIFFDGRGGPPARGGGKTHNFYASMGKNISNKEIQLTIQGQTVSSNFGTIDAAQFNIEQLLNAGISNDLFINRSITLEKNEEEILQELANISFDSYSTLKNHPYFADYLSQISPLRFYSETNIGSRPAKRSGGNRISFKDLRAIPFVGAWSQLKQNVTGYYGVGVALQEMDKQGRFGQLKALYKNSLFFKTLIDNCEMAMKKCFFPLTEYIAKDEKYGEIWNMIHNEFELTQKYVLLLSGKNELMSDYPIDQLSIMMRERIVLPLLTIQQYAITNIREIEDHLIHSPLKETYEKLVIRSSFGIINAGRNSA